MNLLQPLETIAIRRDNQIAKHMPGAGIYICVKPNIYGWLGLKDHESGAISIRNGNRWIRICKGCDYQKERFMCIVEPWRMATTQPIKITH